MLYFLLFLPLLSRSASGRNLHILFLLWTPESTKHFKAPGTFYLILQLLILVHVLFPQLECNILKNMGVKFRFLFVVGNK